MHNTSSKMKFYYTFNNKVIAELKLFVISNRNVFGGWEISKVEDISIAKNRSFRYDNAIHFI